MLFESPNSISESAPSGSYWPDASAMVLELLPYLIWVASNEAKSLYVNKAAREYVGMVPGDDASLRWKDAIHPDDLGSVMERWLNMTPIGQAYEFEYRLRNAIGDYRWFHARCVPQFDDNGRARVWIGTSSDIHESKIAAMRLHLLHQISEAMSSAMTAEELAETALRKGMEALGGHGGTLLKALPGGDAVQRIFSVGGLTHACPHGEIYPLKVKLPMPEAIREGKSLFFCGQKELYERFPEARRVLIEGKSEALAVVPLKAEGRVIGAIGVNFPTKKSFSTEEKALLETFGSACAQALERARRYEEEREARKIAEIEGERVFSILEQAPANIAIVRGPEHRYFYYNSNFARDYAKDGSLIGRTIAECHPELESQGVLAISDDVYRTRKPFVARELEVEQQLPDGQKEFRYFSGTILPWIRENNVEGLINFNLDVTDHVLARRRSETNELRLKQALEAGRLGIWDWDASADRTWRGGFHDRIFGYHEPQMEWNLDSFLSRIHPDDRDRATAAFSSAVMRGGKFEVECRIVLPDGENRWIYDVGEVIMKDGIPVRAIGAVMDITSLKETEVALKRAKDAAEAANRAKTGFVANMSHEFRTPLCAILGFAELLGRDNLTDARRTSYVDGINRNGQVLIKLIDDILDLAKVEAGRIEIELSRVEIRPLVQDVISFFSDEADSRGVHLEAMFDSDVPRLITTDPIRFRQVLTNIVSNAVKFTERGSVLIDVSYRITGKTAAVHVEVCDTGIGIAPDQVARLFQPFGQAVRATRRKYGGTGLGLVISRRLAQTLGGDVTLVRSQPDIGSVFSIDLIDHSSAPAELACVENSCTPTGYLNGRRILIVEDTADVRSLLEEVLTSENAIVDTANDGREGVDKAIDGNYDAILMDLRMPEMDGLEATTYLRQSGLQVPIIALSAYAQGDDKSRAFASGCDAYLTKPVRSLNLIKALCRIIGNSDSKIQNKR